MTRTVFALLLDALLVLAFAVIGRAQHGDPLTLVGVWTTWWPFLGGLAMGWLAVQAWRRPADIWPQGVFVWAITLVGGMVLRQLTGQGTATAFVIVATLVLAAFLLGWRTIAAIAGTRVARRGPSVAARSGALVPPGSGDASGRDASGRDAETGAEPPAAPEGPSRPGEPGGSADSGAYRGPGPSGESGASADSDEERSSLETAAEDLPLATSPDDEPEDDATDEGDQTPDDTPDETDPRPTHETDPRPPDGRP